MKLKAYAARTHQGPYRNLNEDDFDIDVINQLYFILDAYGGAGIGDKAAKSIKENIKNFYTRIAPDPEATMPFYYSPKYLLEGNALINAMRFSHKILYDQNRKRDIQLRAGASCLSFAMSDHIMTMAATGNCVCYLYRQKELRRLIDEDSIFFSAPDSYQAHLKTAPLSGIGLFEDLHLVVRELKVLEDDLFLLMTDGVYSRLSFQEIHSSLEHSDKALPELVDKLFTLSNSRGNLDNQTTLLLRF